MKHLRCFLVFILLIVFGCQKPTEPEEDNLEDFPNRIITTISTEKFPFHIAVTPDGKYVYSTHRSTVDIVTTIRTSDNTVIELIPIGESPHDLDVTPNGNFLYVTNSIGCKISVIRISDNTVIKEISVAPVMPMEIAISPNGDYAYTCSQGILVLRLSDNTVVDSLFTKLIRDIAITPDGKYLYVSHEIWGQVSVIRTSDNSIITEIDVGKFPGALAVTPNGKYVYVTNVGNSTVSVIRTSDNTVIKTINIPVPKCVVISSNGKYAFVGGTEISVIRTSDYKLVKSIELSGYFATDILITPNQKYLYVSIMIDDIIMVIGY